MGIKEVISKNSDGIFNSDHESFQDIRNELLNAILSRIAVLGAPILFFSFFRYYMVGGAITLAMHIGVYLLWVVIAIYRKKIPTQTKTLFVIGCSLIIGVSSILEWGISGSGVAYLIFTSILVTIFYGARLGIVFTVFNLIILVIAAALYGTGVLQLGYNPNDFSSALPIWLTTSSVYVCFTLILVGCLGRLYNSMAVSIENLTNRTQELHQAKQQMEKEIQSRDIAEKALKESEELFRVVLENLPASVYVHDLEGNHLNVNDEACRSSGYSRDELLNKTVQEIETESFNIDIAREIWGHLIETGKTTTFESEKHRKDGVSYDSEVHLKSVVLQGRPAVIAVILDISERKQARVALKESEERFRTVLENLPCGVSVHDLEGRHLIVNEESCTTRGYSREELMNLTVMETAGPGFGAHYNVRKLWEDIEPGASFTIESLSQRKDGSIFESEVHLTKLMLEGRAVILSLVFDITERKKSEEILKKSEEKLARSKKMESLGLLAGSVAHDLNNVLSGIVSYPELLLMDLPEGSNLRKPIKTIRESGNKAVAIVQDLLTIARGAAIIKEPLDLNDVVGEYMLSPEFSNLKKRHPNVDFRTSLSDDLFKISGSSIHIKKVVMNLVSNASEAIEDYGHVTVSTNNRYVDTPISRYEDVKAGEYVVLTVLDNGPGIASENLDRIFEPFFTKKVMGISGTGLGLTVVWNTVQDHDGYIDVKSDKRGTKFELYFPITREEPSSKISSISLDEIKGNGEVILVVDDVRSQREISCRMLDILRYRFVDVSSGEKAIEYLKNNKVDLVLLDMIMSPGISGRETYEQLVKIHPGQKAVIISGYSETEDVVATQKLGAGEYVKKPFDLESLGKAVKKELEK